MKSGNLNASVQQIAPGISSSARRLKKIDRNAMLKKKDYSLLQQYKDSKG